PVRRMRIGIDHGSARVTSTMPAATKTPPKANSIVIGSPRNQTPNAIPHKGWAKPNTDTWLARCRPNSAVQIRKHSQATTTPWYASPQAAALVNRHGESRSTSKLVAKNSIVASELLQNSSCETPTEASARLLTTVLTPINMLLARMIASPRKVAGSETAAISPGDGLALPTIDSSPPKAISRPVSFASETRSPCSRKWAAMATKTGYDPISADPWALFVRAMPK